MAEPSDAVTIDATALDTATNTNCTQLVTQTVGPELCVIAGTQITVNSVVVTGARPLVLAATESITVAGTLDLSSQRSPARVGAGGNASAALCGTVTAAGSNVAGGGGGAGGTFGGRGGNGGIGNNGGVATGTRGISAVLGTLVGVRGGCPGSKGGNAGGGVGGAG